LRRQQDQALGLRSFRDRGQQPGGAKQETEPYRYSPHIPSLPALSSEIDLISVSKRVDDYDAFDCFVEGGAPAQSAVVGEAHGMRVTTLSISATAAAFLPKLNSRDAVTRHKLGWNASPAAEGSRLQTTVMKRSAAHFHVGI
jgi:hypothetical protein